MIISGGSGGWMYEQRWVSGATVLAWLAFFALMGRIDTASVG